MGEVNKTNGYTDFYYHAFRNILLISVPVLIISTIILSSLHSSATGSSSDTDSLTISISYACTLSSVVNTEHSDNVKAGTYKDNIGKTTIKTTCNDNNGYSIYANGYSNNEEGNNKLVNTLSSSNVIETGLNTSGDISSWAMKLNNIPDDPSPTPPVIESAYDDTYGPIPSNWTKVLSLPSGSTDMSLGSSFTTTYAVYANSRQYTGTYQGQVKYVLTHPMVLIISARPPIGSCELGEYLTVRCKHSRVEGGIGLVRFIVMEIPMLLLFTTQECIQQVLMKISIVAGLSAASPDNASVAPYPPSAASARV